MSHYNFAAVWPWVDIDEGPGDLLVPPQPPDTGRPGCFQTVRPTVQTLPEWTLRTRHVVP